MCFVGGKNLLTIYNNESSLTCLAGQVSDKTKINYYNHDN